MTQKPRTFFKIPKNFSQIAEQLPKKGNFFACRKDFLIGKGNIVREDREMLAQSQA